jgi:ribose-phosphate pyrophosphokinase
MSFCSSLYHVARAAARAPTVVGGVFARAVFSAPALGSARASSDRALLAGVLAASALAVAAASRDAASEGAQSPAPASTVDEEMVLFSGNANPELAAEIAALLGTTLGDITVARFADGEVNVQVHDNVRGKDVFIMQPTSAPVNEHLMELLLMVSTMRRASAERITAVIPYYGYARQDRKMMSRVPISAADVARLLEAMGVDRVVAVDLHCGQIQGFFGPRVPVDNLDAGIIGVKYFANKGLSNIVVVSPDAGGVYRCVGKR